MVRPELPSGRPHGKHPPKRNRRKWLWRTSVLIVSAVLVVLYLRAYLLIASTHIHFFFVIMDDWSVLFVLYTLAFLQTPYGAFGSIAAIIFAIGWYLRWPAVVRRRRPWLRGSTLLAAVFVLHGIWFQFGWAPFRPPCIVDSGSIIATSHRSLVGPMTPEAALESVDTLNWRDREVARLSGEHDVLARPARVLFDDGGVWNNTMKIAESLAEEQGLPSPDFDQRNECAELERVVMLGGRAEEFSSGWGTWPWDTFDEQGDVVRWLRRVAR